MTKDQLPDNSSRSLTTAEAAQLYGVSLTVIHVAVKEGRLPSERRQSRHVFKREDVEVYKTAVGVRNGCISWATKRSTDSKDTSDEKDWPEALEPGLPGLLERNQMDSDEFNKRFRVMRCAQPITPELYQVIFAEDEFQDTPGSFPTGRLVELNPMALVNFVIDPPDIEVRNHERFTDVTEEDFKREALEAVYRRREAHKKRSERLF